MKFRSLVLQSPILDVFRNLGLVDRKKFASDLQNRHELDFDGYAIEQYEIGNTGFINHLFLLGRIPVRLIGDEKCAEIVLDVHPDDDEPQPPGGAATLSGNGLNGLSDLFSSKEIFQTYASAVSLGLDEVAVGSSETQSKPQFATDEKSDEFVFRETSQIDDSPSTFFSVEKNFEIPVDEENRSFEKNTLEEVLIFNSEYFEDIA